MQVVEAHQKFSDDYGDILFGNQAWLQEVGAATTRAELHYDPEVRSFQEGPVVFCDIGRVEL